MLGVAILQGGGMSWNNWEELYDRKRSGCESPRACSQRGEVPACIVTVQNCVGCVGRRALGVLSAVSGIGA